jgi:hypothetical protein
VNRCGASASVHVLDASGLNLMHVREGVDHWNRAATVKCGGRAAASGELDPAPDVSRRPGKSPLLCLTALFHLGCYKRWLASLGSYS